MTEYSESNKESVSVIIPAFNRARTIIKAINSALEQSVPPAEVIVVDDGSTDETASVVEAISDSRLICIRQPVNSGAQMARNRGIREANGNWIAFLDSDDTWLPNILERQLDALACVDFNPLTVVYTNCWLHNVELGKMKKLNISYVSGDRPFRQMLYSSGPMFQGLMTSRDALEMIGLLDEAVPAYQEWDTFIRLAKYCHFVHIMEPLFVYNIHGGDTISGDMRRDIAAYQFIVDKFQDDILRECGISVLYYHLLFNASKALSYGFFDEAKNVLQRIKGRSLIRDLLLFLCRKRLSIPHHILLNDLFHSLYMFSRKLIDIKSSNRGVC